MSSVLRRSAAFTAHEKPVAGDVKTSFVGYDHLGWLKCDGRSVSTTQFNLLFQVIGYTFGGSGNNFNLPDLSGRVQGSVGGSHTAGQYVGTDEHTLTIAEMPAHNHGTNASNTEPGNNLTGISGEHTHTGTALTNGAHTHTQTTVNDDFNNSGAYPNYNTPSYAQYDSAGSITWTNTINSNGAHSHTLSIDQAGNHQHSIATQGGGQPHNNIQPTLFYGNTFVYSGIPTYPGFPYNPASAWPYTTGLVPPLI